MPEPIEFKSYPELLDHVESIEHMFFDHEGAKHVKTKLLIGGGHDFQTTHRVNGGVSNLTYIQNNNVNTLLQIVEEKIRERELTEFNGIAVSFTADEELDPADVDPNEHKRY